MSIATEKGNRNLIKLLSFCFVLMMMWLLPDIFRSENLRVLWFIGAALISVFLAVKYKCLTKKDVFISVFLGGLAAISHPVNGITAMLSYIGGQSVLRNTRNGILLLKTDNKKAILITILLAIGTGTVLGIINLILGRASGMTLNPGFSLEWLALAFSAGISEEIIFRYLLFAICVHIVKDKALSKFESILCYFIMVVPHVLIHFNLHNFNLMNGIILAVFFGLPFAILQRKRDLMSAMGSHFLVDLIRFVIYRA